MKAVDRNPLKLLAYTLIIALSCALHQYAAYIESNIRMSAFRSFSLDSRLFNPTLYANLLKLWFNGLPTGATASSGELAKRWFGAGANESEKAAFDHECHSAFNEALSSIAPAKFDLPVFSDVETDRDHYTEIAAPFLGQFYENGSGNPEAALGLSLLLDQIPRNVFRNNQVVIYGHFDRIARAVFYALHKLQLDQHDQYRMSPVHRTWFYMPLMHSESLADHQLFGHIMQDFKSKLEIRGDQSGIQNVEQMLSFEAKHADIIESFGRYPYRNGFLGRKTTAEEQKWLDEGGERFSS